MSAVGLICARGLVGCAGTTRDWRHQTRRQNDGGIGAAELTVIAYRGDLATPYDRFLTEPFKEYMRAILFRCAPTATWLPLRRAQTTK